MVSNIGGTVVFALASAGAAVIGGGVVVVKSESSFIVTFPKGITGTLQGANNPKYSKYCIMV